MGGARCVLRVGCTVSKTDEYPLGILRLLDLRCRPSPERRGELHFARRVGEQRAVLAEERVVEELEGAGGGRGAV